MKPSVKLQGFIAGFRQPEGSIIMRFSGRDAINRSTQYAQGALTGRKVRKVVTHPVFWTIILLTAFMLWFSISTDNAVKRCFGDNPPAACSPPK
jgi:hypothetical protein